MTGPYQRAAQAYALGSGLSGIADLLREGREQREKKAMFVAQLLREQEAERIRMAPELIAAGGGLGPAPRQVTATATPSVMTEPDTGRTMPVPGAHTTPLTETDPNYVEIPGVGYVKRPEVREREAFARKVQEIGETPLTPEQQATVGREKAQTKYYEARAAEARAGRTASATRPAAVERAVMEHYGYRNEYGDPTWPPGTDEAWRARATQAWEHREEMPPMPSPQLPSRANWPGGGDLFAPPRASVVPSAARPTGLGGIADLTTNVAPGPAPRAPGATVAPPARPAATPAPTPPPTSAPTTTVPSLISQEEADSARRGAKIPVSQEEYNAAVQLKGQAYAQQHYVVRGLGARP